jgi:hypothetical protein
MNLRLFIENRKKAETNYRKLADSTIREGSIVSTESESEYGIVASTLTNESRKISPLDTSKTTNVNSSMFNTLIYGS